MAKKVLLLEYLGPEPTGILVVGTKVAKTWPLEEALPDTIANILGTLGIEAQIMDITDFMWDLENAIDDNIAYRLLELKVSQVIQTILDTEGVDGLTNPITPERAKAIVEACEV